MPTNKLTAYLDENNVKYKVIKHPVAYTAQEIAAAAHIPGERLAKTVMVKIDGKMAMAVIPAPERVSFELLMEQAGASKVELANEKEFKELFPDCDLGAMPPFGNLYDIPVYASKKLGDEIEIAFCGGEHGELIRMSFDDFKRLVKPKLLDISWAE